MTVKISPAACAAFFAALASLPFYGNAVPAGPAAHVHGVAALEVTVDAATLEIRLDTPLANLLGFEHPPTTAVQRAAVNTLNTRLHQPAQLFSLPADAGCSVNNIIIEAPSLALDAVVEKPAGSKAAADRNNQPAPARPPAGMPGATAGAGHEAPDRQDLASANRLQARQRHARQDRPGDFHGNMQEHDHDHEAGRQDKQNAAHADAHADLVASYVFDCRHPAALRHIDLGLMRQFPGVLKVNVQTVGPQGQAASVLDKTTTRLAW